MAARFSNALIKLDVVQDDVRYVAADVLLLKFARRLHGADESVVCQLIQAGVCSNGSVAPETGQAQWVAGGTAIQAKQILFIGTPRFRIVSLSRNPRVRQTSYRVYRAQSANRSRRLQLPCMALTTDWISKNRSKL